MKVRDIMTTSVVSVSAEDTVLIAAKAMRDHHVGDVVVVEKTLSGTYPRGILTDRDLVVGVLAQNIAAIDTLLVKDVMGQEVHVIDSEKDLIDAAQRMRRFGIRRLPVVNRLEVLIGIVALDDIVAAMAETLANLAQLSPEQVTRERVRRA